MILFAFLTFGACQKKDPNSATQTVAPLKDPNAIKYPLISKDVTVEEVFGISNTTSLERQFALAYLLKSDPTQFLYQPEITTLSDEKAKWLAEFDGRFLALNGLDTITPSALNILANFGGSTLIFSKLSSMSLETAQAMAQVKVFELYLNGLTSIDGASATELAKFKGGFLSLGLKTLDMASAQALATFNGEVVYLNQLQQLDASLAGALAQYKGGVLSLNSLTALDVLSAQALASFGGDTLMLKSLQTIDEETATALAEFNGYIEASTEIMEPINAIALERRKSMEMETVEVEIERTKTDSGLEFFAIRATSGTKPTVDQRVRFHYIAQDGEGNIFESSVARKLPMTVEVGRTLPGLTEGLQLMSVGDRYRFWIPENLAYQGHEDLPKGTLVFDVELLEILP